MSTFPLDVSRRPTTARVMALGFHLSLWGAAWLALAFVMRTSGFGCLERDLCRPVANIAVFAIPVLALLHSEASKSESWEDYARRWVEALFGNLVLSLVLVLFAVQFLAPVFGETSRWAAPLVLVAMAVIRGVLSERKTQDGSGVKVLRGAKVGSKPRDTSKRKDVPPLYFGGELIRTTDPHFFVLGTTGGGKSLTIQMLLSSIVRDYAPKKALHAFSFDVKGDQVALFEALGVPAKDIHNLDPFHQEGEAWDIAADIEESEDADKIAAAMLPSYNAKDPFWVDAPRRLFSVAMETFQVCHPKEWDLLDVIELFGCPNEEIVRFLGQSHHGTRVIRRYFEADERLLSNVLSTLDTQLGKFEVVARLWRQATRKYSVRRWVSERKGVMLLRRNPNEKDSTQEIGRTIFEVAARALMKESSNDRNKLLKDNTWVLLDEFDQIGRLETVTELLRLGRASRVRVIIGSQGMDGIMETYESEHAARSIVEQCQNMAILRISGKGSMDWAASTVGEQDIEDRNQSFTQGQQPSSTVSISTKTRDAILGSEFRDIPETGPDTGLTGHYITTEGGVWKYTIAWSEVLRRIPDIQPESYKSRASVPAERYAWTLAQKQHFGALPKGDASSAKGVGGGQSSSPPTNGEGPDDEEPPTLQTLGGIHK